MSASLDRALELILAHEGGWSAHPSDRGGATQFGVTHGTLADWRGRIGNLPSNVRDLTQDQAREIYRRGYWDASGCDLLPWPVCYAQMDAAVQHGPARARKWLQKGLKVTADGIFGPQTREAIGRVGHWWRPLSRMLLHRADLYIRILRTPSQAAFASGWANRLEAVVRTCDRDTPDLMVPRQHVGRRTRTRT